GAEPVPDRFAFGVRAKGKLRAFVWVWMERVDPKKARVPNHGVVAARVASLAHRDRLLAEYPTKLFTEPHYEGFPAVLVRLEAVRVPELRAWLTEAWRTQAPVDLVKRGRRSSPAGASKNQRSAP